MEINEQVEEAHLRSCKAMMPRLMEVLKEDHFEVAICSVASILCIMSLNTALSKEDLLKFVDLSWEHLSFDEEFDF